MVVTLGSIAGALVILGVILARIVYRMWRDVSAVAQRVANLEGRTRTRRQEDDE